MIRGGNGPDRIGRDREWVHVARGKKKFVSAGRHRVPYNILRSIAVRRSILQDGRDFVGAQQGKRRRALSEGVRNEAGQRDHIDKRFHRPVPP